VFANPGTSELALVDALALHGPRPILVAHELAATGAADAQARLLGLGAALLHLGPGLANGLSFVHNARRARSPLLVLLGEHPRTHLTLDPPLALRSDALATAIDAPFVVVDDPAQAASQLRIAASCAQRRRGPVIVALDAVAMERDLEAPSAPEAVLASEPPEPPAGRLEAAASLLGAGEAVLLLGGRALEPPARRLAFGIAAATGARVLAETFPAVHDYGRGAGLIERLAYLPELARPALSQARALVLVGTPWPVAWFAHPGVEARLWPPDAPVLRVDEGDVDEAALLGRLAEALGAPALEGSEAEPPPLQPEGAAIDAAALTAAIVRAVRDGDVVVDEARTSAPGLYEALATAAPHTYVGHPGGAIGEGISLGLGAATLGRRVLAVVADGGSLYAPQALWTMAREGTDATIVILANGGYRILEIEQQLQGLPPRPAMTRLAEPAWDFAGLARSMGARATTAGTAGELSATLAQARGVSVIVAQLES
jgi:acetolactate synthase-1/2/3 large subunit